MRLQGSNKSNPVSKREHLRGEKSRWNWDYTKEKEGRVIMVFKCMAGYFKEISNQLFSV